MRKFQSEHSISEINLRYSEFKSYKEPENFSPLAAQKWAELIVRHWRSCFAAGEIDNAAPLEILDFMPGQGYSLWLITRALDKCIQSNPDLRIQYRYLPVITNREWLKLFNLSADLKNLYHSFVVVPLLWDRKNTNACLIFPDKREIWKPANPVVMLMHDFWTEFPQKLLAVHYGKLMEADLSLLSFSIENKKNTKDNNKSVWKKCEINLWPEDLSVLMDQYVSQLNSAPLTYPYELIDFLNVLCGLIKRSYLLLAASHGYATIQELRTVSFDQIIHRFKLDNDSKYLPVNYHLIKAYLQSFGIHSEEVKLQQNNILQIALFGHSDARARLDRLADSVDRGMFQYEKTIIKSMNLMRTKETLDSRLNLIMLSNYDPVVFWSGHADLLAEFKQFSPNDRSDWKKAIRLIWENYRVHFSIPELHIKLAIAAMYLSDWSLAREILKGGMIVFGRNSTELAHLAWCDARTGKLIQAKEAIKNILDNDPTHLLAKEVNKRIIDRLSSWDDQWRYAVNSKDKNLALEPLDLSHAEAFLLQYRDPQISVMTGLPVLENIEKVRSWINEQNADINHINYAVMHESHGFVGYINLSVSLHAAYFCFWIGIDYQGNGMATAASRMAFDIAKKNGITLLLTSAYADNLRSIRALTQLGFKEIAVRALPPDQDRIFYSLIIDEASFFSNISSEIIDYYKRENLSLEFC